MTTIDLKKRFGNRFKVGYGASYDAEYGPNARTVDPWYMEILCQHGTICPWGGNNLAACTFKSGPVANRLRRLPFLDRDATMDGADGINAVFDLRHFDEVANIMKPRKRPRRNLTPEQRREIGERLRRARLGAQPMVERPKTTLVCVESALGRP